MTSSYFKIRPADVIRYSKEPQKSYQRKSRGVLYGSAGSPMIDTTERWNLAYLSQDYEKEAHHPDPMFSVHIRRTTQTLLDGSGLDLCGQHEIGHLVAGLLHLPAPRFVYLIQRHSILTKLPLYLAYGDAWLDLIERRSRICLYGDDSEAEPSLSGAADCNEAREILDHIRKR